MSGKSTIEWLPLCDAFAKLGTLWHEAVETSERDGRVFTETRTSQPPPLDDCFAELMAKGHAGEIIGSGCLNNAHGRRVAFELDDWDYLRKCPEHPPARHPRSPALHWTSGVLWMPEPNGRFAAETIFFDCLFARNSDPLPLQKKPRNSRPPGRSLEKSDAPLIEEMRRLIVEERLPSPSAAAARVVNQAMGGGTEESKISRLVRRYAENNGE